MIISFKKFNQYLIKILFDIDLIYISIQQNNL